MAQFIFARSAATPTVGNDLWTLIAAANRRDRIVEVSVSGTAGTSAGAAYNESFLARSSGGTTGGGALTVSKLENDSAAFAGTVNTTWSGQPTVTATDGGVRFAFNVYGGGYRWVARRDSEIIVRNTEQLSLRQVSGTAALTMHTIVDEL